MALFGRSSPIPLMDEIPQSYLKDNTFKESYESSMGMNLGSNDKKDAEVIIKLFSVDPTTKDLIISLTGKYYDKQKNKIVTIGTSHINDKGLREIMPLVKGMINNSITKGRLENEIIEEFNFTSYLTLSGFLMKNRVDFGIKKESIRVITTILNQLHYIILSRALNGSESDNTLIHTLRNTESSSSGENNGYYSNLFKKSRIGR